MSTKCSISYEPDQYHFYEECFDSDNVWLELEGPLTANVEINGAHRSVTVAIPVQAFRKILEDWNKSHWGQHPERDGQELSIDFDRLTAELEVLQKDHDE